MTTNTAPLSPPPRRAERYRQFARETLRLADTTEVPEFKATYISLSACWNRLAQLAEHAADLQDGDPRLDGVPAPEDVALSRDATP